MLPKCRQGGKAKNFNVQRLSYWLKNQKGYGGYDRADSAYKLGTDGGAR